MLVAAVHDLETKTNAGEVILKRVHWKEAFPKLKDGKFILPFAEGTVQQPRSITEHNNFRRLPDTSVQTEAVPEDEEPEVGEYS